MTANRDDPTLVAAPDGAAGGTGGTAGGRDGPARRRRSAGPRAVARRRRRRRALLRSTLAIVLTVVLGVGAVVAAATLVTDAPEQPAVDDPAPAAGAVLDPQPTLVLATFDEAATGRGASQVVVLGYDREAAQATMLFVPAGTVADVPGHGLLQVGRAFGFGDGPLLDATLDNLLGVDLDAVVGVSQQGWASLFTRLDGLAIDVPERLDRRNPDGSTEARFRPGEQFLDGPRVAELLTFREANETELEAISRLHRVLVAMLDRVADDPALLDAVFADGAPMLDTAAAAGEVQALLRLLAEAQAEGRLVARTLPVSPVGSGEDESYRVDEERARQLVEDRFAGSRPVTASVGGRDLQILNGNGVPGIGQRVAERLVPAGFRVVLTRNADRFDHAETRIVVYRDDPEQLAAAEEIRDLLGVGRVELSRTPLQVADVTVVVGLDFLERAG
jgi:anionic cell wall polymer biosynthesis LytR-Cps2A-Psr (LCP) family protein